MMEIVVVMMMMMIVIVNLNWDRMDEKLSEGAQHQAVVVPKEMWKGEHVVVDVDDVKACSCVFFSADQVPVLKSSD